MKRGLLLWLATLPACAARRAPAPKPPEPRAINSACDRLTREGDDKLETGDWPGAVQQYRSAVGECRDARGVTVKLARALSAVDDDDAAAELLFSLVTAPAPPPDAFLELKKLSARVSPKVRQELAHLGSSPERPVHVPAEAFEYSWVAAFACPDGHATVRGQSLARGPKGALNVLEISCGEEPARSVFFDFSADPLEKGE